MNTKTYIGILAVVAIVLGIVGFFFNWIEFATSGETGYETLFQGGKEAVVGTYTVYAVAMLIALVGCLIMLIPTMKGWATKGIKFLSVLLGAIMLICALFMFFDLERMAGMGIFIEIASGLMLFISMTALVFIK